MSNPTITYGYATDTSEIAIRDSTTLNGIHDNTGITIDGNLVVNNGDIEERLEIIERVLRIPNRDYNLEQKYPHLKDIFYDYINVKEKGLANSLEELCEEYEKYGKEAEKLKTFDILNNP